VAGVPRAVVGGHAALALTGLGIWIGFLVTGATALAWTAVGVVLAVAGLGMATLAGGLPQGTDETAASAAPGGAEPASTRLADPGSAGSGSVTSRSAAVGPASARVLPSRMTAIQLPSGKPLALIALHGVLAAATILLVVLAAAGAG
jgi:hypothetical protein